MQVSAFAESDTTLGMMHETICRLRREIVAFGEEREMWARERATFIREGEVLREQLREVTVLASIDAIPSMRSRWKERAAALVARLEG